MFPSNSHRSSPLAVEVSLSVSGALLALLLMSIVVLRKQQTSWGRGIVISRSPDWLSLIVTHKARVVRHDVRCAISILSIAKPVDAIGCAKTRRQGLRLRCQESSDDSLPGDKRVQLAVTVLIVALGLRPIALVVFISYELGPI